MIFHLNASHLEELLGDGRGDDARTTRSGDQTHHDGRALAGDLKKEHPLNPDYKIVPLEKDKTCLKAFRPVFWDNKE